MVDVALDLCDVLGARARRNGFVAAFLAGLAFGRLTRSTLEEPIGFTECIGLFASFLVWAVFGAVFAAPGLQSTIDVSAVVYAP